MAFSNVPTTALIVAAHAQRVHIFELRADDVTQYDGTLLNEAYQILFYFEQELDARGIEDSDDEEQYMALNVMAVKEGAYNADIEAALDSMADFN